jgi:uncharacterized membrane protein
MNALESVFSFLFKYRPLVFERGDFAFTTPWPGFIIAAAAAAVAVPTVFLYGRVKGKTQRRDRAVLSVLRTCVLALLLFSLFRPVLVLSTVVPQRNVVGVLLDDSRSMRIADMDGQARADVLQGAFGDPASDVVRGLTDRFIVRTFRFSSAAERLDDPTALTFSGGKTDLGRALDHARAELASVPLAGLVVVTDGADNSAESLAEPLLALQAAGVPVHTVGIGRDVFTRDIEVGRVQAPRRVLEGTALGVDLVVRQRGYENTTVPLIVEDDGRIVATQDVALRRDGEATPVRVHFTVTEPGPRLFKFRIPARDGEMVEQNNEQDALIIVQNRRERILYFEGQPRFEIKYMRRALVDDDNIELVTLVRTAENKFYRLGIDPDNPEELAGGFPRTREELFQYRGLILGSVEASYFTHDQLAMIADFVGQRGGGLLLLGGARAFAEGGYAGTPVEDVLPVILEELREGFIAEVFVEQTPAGRVHPGTQIADSEEASEERWKSLPSVTVLNPLTRAKPGATTLLQGRSPDSDDPLIVLAVQRYGRGKVLALPIQDLWTWQMHHEIPLEDQTLETFWQQVSRWLVSLVPDRVGVQTPGDRVAPSEPVELLATVEDDRYLRVNNTDVSVRVLTPTGAEQQLQMDWTVDRDGEYRATYTPTDQGLHQIEVTVRDSGEFFAADTSFLQVTDLAREFYDAEMQQAALRRIADETGGQFYTPSTLSSLPEDISYTESGTTVIEENDLWDMPILFVLVVGLVSLEWGFRRVRGLV